MKGQDYLELKDSYILFICKNDPFKDELGKAFGLPCYTFRNVCIEDSTINLNDKSHKVIYNVSAFRKENDEQIRAFLHFICTNEPGKDDFSKRLFELWVRNSLKPAAIKEIDKQVLNTCLSINYVFKVNLDVL